MTPGQKVATIIYFVSVAGSIYFVAGRILTRFWRYQEGIALLLQHLALVGLGAQTVLVLTLGENLRWQVPLSIVLLLVFTAAVWWLTILQEQGRKRAQAAQSPSPETRPPLEDHQLS